MCLVGGRLRHTLAAWQLLEGPRLPAAQPFGLARQDTHPCLLQNALHALRLHQVAKGEPIVVVESDKAGAAATCVFALCQALPAILTR